MLVEQGVQVQEVFGRNHNLRIASGSGLGLFLKQAPPEDRRLDGPLAVEASLYQWAASRTGGLALAAFLPHLIRYDAPNAVLTFELLPSAVSGTITTETCREAARMLAACHAIERKHNEASLRGFSSDSPWVFDVARPSPASLRELAPAQLALFEAVQASAPLEAVLARMRGEWRASSLIHGDFKWSNVVSRPRPYLLDWELAQWGDPAWDVGGALHAVIVEDILATELPSDGGPERLMETFGALLSARAGDHRSFWKTYCTERTLSGSLAEELLERVPAQAGLRFVKTAYEWCQSETRVPRRAAAILQLGINLLVRPAEAALSVLGLG